MERLQRAALLLSLIENLKAKGSWCGETHIQKTVYFLQKLLKVPFKFEFVLYKHGPYSFDLSDEISFLRAHEILEIQPRDYPYGQKICPGKPSMEIKERFPRTLKKYEQHIKFITDKLAEKNVAELERLATALYVAEEIGYQEDKGKMAKSICELKPHVLINDARNAILELDEIIEESNKLLSE